MTRMDSARLRDLLMIDALISGVTGVALIAVAGVAEPMLNVPAAVMRAAGLILLPYATLVLFVSRSEQLTRSLVGIVIALNVGWVVASVLVLVSSWIQPTTLGVAFIVVQALVVGALAELQFTGWRRSVHGA